MPSFYVTDSGGVKKAVNYDALSPDGKQFVNDAIQRGEVYNTVRGVTVADAEGNEFVCDGLDTAVFFARQLTSIKARSFDVQYAELKFRQLFPVSNEAPAGAETIIFYTYDQSAMAKLIGNYADDIPLAEIGGKETPIRVKGSALGFEVTAQDLRASAMAGNSIPDRKTNAVTRGHEELLNEIAFFGSDADGLIGLFNNPNIPIGAVPNGAGGNPEWSTKSPDEILADMFSITNDIWSDTLMIEQPNTLLLPPEQYKLIESTPRSDVSDTTIMQFFVANSRFIGMDGIIPVNEMTGAGTAGADVMVAYNRSPDKMQLEIPMELFWHPEQRRNLSLFVPSEVRFAGLNVYYPGSVKIEEDI